MSVPVYRRNPNKLQAYADTVAMIKYTLQMCENPKIFPKKCRWTICQRLIDFCLDSEIKIRLANKIVANNIELAKERLKLQKQVLQNFEAMWGLMTIAYELYSVPTQKIDTWSQLMLTAEDRVSGWRKYDVDRFKKDFKSK